MIASTSGPRSNVMTQTLGYYSVKYTCVNAFKQCVSVRPCTLLSDTHQSASWSPGPGFPGSSCGPQAPPPPRRPRSRRWSARRPFVFPSCNLMMRMNNDILVFTTKTNERDRCRLFTSASFCRRRPCLTRTWSTTQRWRGAVARFCRAYYFMSAL